MAIAQCPFWVCCRDGVLVCEGARIPFAGEREMRAYMGRYCASREGWRDCSVAKLLESRYERDSSRWPGGIMREPG